MLELMHQSPQQAMNSILLLDHPLQGHLCKNVICSLFSCL